jgi:hypothetical protein
MNNMYKRCFYCGKELYRDETRCRYCRKWQNRFADDYDRPPSYDERYESLIDDEDEVIPRDPSAETELDYPEVERHPPRHRRPMSSVTIGGIIVAITLVGLIIVVMLVR